MVVRNSPPQNIFLPRIVGHRGAASHAPENTFEGIAMARQMGLEAVEVDGVLTADAIPVLFHDAALDRTSTGHGPVGAYSLKDLQALDAGAWFGKGFSGAKIPTLADAITYATGLNLQMNIEIKPQPDAEDATARKIVKIVQAHWPTDRKPPLLSSFSMTALASARDEAPGQPRAAIFAHGTPDDWLSQANPLSPVAIHINKESLDRDTVATLNGSGFAVGAYTVNSRWEAQRLFDAGVDYIFTDAPDEVAGVTT